MMSESPTDLPGVDPEQFVGEPPTGEADPALRRALTSAGEAEVVERLASARLFVPVKAVATDTAEGEHGVVSDKEADMATTKTTPVTTGATPAADTVADQVNAADAAVHDHTARTVADPAPAPALEDASGALIEPEVAQAIDITHASVDANPRAGTTAVQNAVDWNDPKRVRPTDPQFAGQGIDRSGYGAEPD